ncbi:MAG: HlyD family type I secretion periplasmic adaptor subunit [Alphaproteobacteria bacterium]|nr:HlyD family type I secretion periplasmic adaptor subunit [Alphaproteobacteria bacterium]
MTDTTDAALSGNAHGGLPQVSGGKWLHTLFADDLDRLVQPMMLEETKLPKVLRLSVAVLAGAALCFLGWAAMTPVKELARTDGQVIPSGYSRLVQHLEGGLVREILVHEGDFVQKDQLLMRIDGAGTEEDRHEQNTLVTALAMQAERLRAMLDDRAPDFSAIAMAPGQQEEQHRMFEAMSESNHRDLGILVEQVGQKQRALARLGEMLVTAKSNLTVAREGKDIYAKLQQDGLTTRSNYLNKLEAFNTRKGDVAAITQQIEVVNRELAEYRQRLDALTAQQRDTAFTDLHEVETRLLQAQEELKKRANRVDRLEVRAPVMGYVKGLKVNTIGAVIPAGQTLMEIVPADDKLTVEIRILPQQIGRVAIGQEARVKVNSYDYIRYGAIPAKLEYISAMTFTDEARQEDYYKGRVLLQRNYVGEVPGLHPIIPGMTVDAEIVTGEKTVLGYLLRPIHNALHNAMTEQ